MIRIKSCIYRCIIYFFKLKKIRRICLSTICIIKILDIFTIFICFGFIIRIFTYRIIRLLLLGIISSTCRILPIFSVDLYGICSSLISFRIFEINPCPISALFFIRRNKILLYIWTIGKRIITCISGAAVLITNTLDIFNTCPFSGNISIIYPYILCKFFAQSVRWQFLQPFLQRLKMDCFLLLSIILVLVRICIRIQFNIWLLPGHVISNFRILCIVYNFKNFERFIRGCFTYDFLYTGHHG